MPRETETLAAQYKALCQHAGVLDLSFRSLLIVGGSDAVTFLNNMVTNDVRSLRNGSGCNALKVSLQGKIEAALRLLRVDEEIWCDLEPGPRDALIDALRKRVLLADVSVDDASDAWALLSVQGPHADSVFAALDVDVRELQTLHAHCAATLAQVPVRVVRSDHTGEAGYDVFVDAARAPVVRDALFGADTTLRPVGLAALDARRIEAGIPWAGRELTPDRLPQEAGLEDGWVSYTKGCYLGQETISRLHHLGHVNRHLRGLLIEGDVAPEAGSVLQVNGKAAGSVTSAAFSPRLDRPIALGYVHRQHAEPGTRVEVASGPTVTTAEVTALPMC